MPAAVSWERTRHPTFGRKYAILHSLRNRLAHRFHAKRNLFIHVGFSELNIFFVLSCTSPDSCANRIGIFAFHFIDLFEYHVWTCPEGFHHVLSSVLCELTRPLPCWWLSKSEKSNIRIILSDSTWCTMTNKIAKEWNATGGIPVLTTDLRDTCHSSLFTIQRQLNYFYHYWRTAAIIATNASNRKINYLSSIVDSEMKWKAIKFSLQRELGWKYIITGS